MERKTVTWMGVIALSAALLGLTAPVLAGQAEIDAQMKLLTGDNAEARQKARAALTEMGAPAIKSLLQAVGSKNRSVGKAARMTLHDIVVPTGRVGGEYDRQAVCKVLTAELGNAALPKRTREYVCRLLSYVGREDVVDALVTAMSAPDVGEMARWALSRNPTSAALDALHTALDKAAPEARVGLINAVGARRERRSAPLLVKQLADADEAVRLAAMDALSRIADPSTMDVFEALLTTGSAKQQKAAREAWFRLGETLQASGRPYAASLMFEAALKWKDATVQDRCAALVGVGKAGQPNATAVLLETVGTAANRDVCGAVAQALETMPSPDVTPAVVEMLSRKRTLWQALAGKPALPAPSRVTLLNVLTRRNDKAGQPGALAALKADEAEVRIAALKCLAVIGEASAAPSLAPSLQKADDDERQAAVEALGRLPAPEGLTWLYDEVNRDGLSDDYRCLLIRSVSERREPGSVEALSKVLGKSASETVRVCAFEALGKIGQAAALPALLEGVNKEAGKDRDSAEHAMRKLEAAATEPMVNAVAKATPHQKVALLKVLGLASHPKIKSLLIEGYQDKDARIKSAAIEGLRRMADPSTLKYLEEAGAKGPAKGPAVSGMINIAVKLEKPNRAEALRIYHKALKLATRDKEIKPALDRLAKLGDVSSFDAVTPLLSKGSAKANAAEAALATAVKLPDARKADGIAAIKAALGIVPNSGRAKAAVKKLQGWGVEIDLASEAGFVTHWWMTGPFPSPDMKLFEGKAFPEDKVDLAAKTKVGDKEYVWKKVHIPGTDGIADLRKMVAEADSVGCYCYAEVTADQAQDVIFKIGSDDAVMCWLNGKKIHGNKVSRGLEVDSDKVKARLEKGVNRILMKVLNGGGPWSMCLRITDPKDKPLKLEQRKK